MTIPIEGYRRLAAAVLLQAIQNADKYPAGTLPHPHMRRDEREALGRSPEDRMFLKSDDCKPWVALAGWQPAKATARMVARGTIKAAA